MTGIYSSLAWLSGGLPTLGSLPSPSSRPLSLQIIYPERTAYTSTTTQLFEQEQKQGAGSVLFSGADGLTTTTNPLHSFLS
jgi:hypothetical protein